MLCCPAQVSPLRPKHTPPKKASPPRAPITRPLSELRMNLASQVQEDLLFPVCTFHLAGSTEKGHLMFCGSRHPPHLPGAEPCKAVELSQTLPMLPLASDPLRNGAEFLLVTDLASCGSDPG